MANTGLSHSDITAKFDPADLESDVDIEITEGPDGDGLAIVDEHPASEETSPDYFDTPAFDTPANEAVSPDRDFVAPVDEEIVEPPPHADARCVEAKQHVTNCSCTGSCRGPF